MLALFIITTVALAIFCVVRELKHAEMKRSRDFWFDRWEGEIQDNTQLIEEMTASEQGIKEIEENYQQELLSEYDEVKRLTEVGHYWLNMANKLEEIRVDHDVYCLPNVGDPILDMNEDEPTPIFDSVSPQPALF